MHSQDNFFSQLSGNPPENIPEEIKEQLKGFQDIYITYQSAIKEIGTKIEILNDEFQAKQKRNPIEHIKSRVKSTKSIVKKLQRKGLPVTLDSARENLTDIAGIRIICSFIDDIYIIADLLSGQDDIVLVEKIDYIQKPKPSGYRSLHLILQVPVFFSDHTEHVKVEVQIRTIAMDFWASLEHKLHYKGSENVPDSISEELRECADIIAETDRKMQNIHNRLEEIN
ncbi:MAG: GTP pyrophosphokinase family protein [Peptococcaceae bacterium]|nr:GTP pyrophosphokinase family protein [Peptococcaceae bacterium]